jgi:hypothetical protein
MALITSPTEMIPDLNYEYHTITVDTLNQASSNSFTCFLSQPIKNVVQARLLAARIRTKTATEHCYISMQIPPHLVPRQYRLKMNTQLRPSM